MGQSLEVEFAALDREAQRYGDAAAELEAHRDYARRQREQVKETMCRWHYEAAGAAMERGWEESANRHDTLVNARRGMQEDTHAASRAYQSTEDASSARLLADGPVAPPNPPGGVCVDPGAIDRNSRTNRPDGLPYEPDVRPIRPGEAVRPPYLTHGDLSVPPERRAPGLPECSTPDDGKYKGAI